MNVNAQSTKGLAIPFDHDRLDRLMDEAGIDVVLATSKHNVQYLLGGHRADFFDYMVTYTRQYRCGERNPHRVTRR